MTLVLKSEKPPLREDETGAIAFYLKNKDEVGKYLDKREELAKSVKQRLEAIRPDLSQIRSRLLSQRNL